jgi:hypothetical protein
MMNSGGNQLQEFLSFNIRHSIFLEAVSGVVPAARGYTLVIEGVKS